MAKQQNVQTLTQVDLDKIAQIIDIKILPLDQLTRELKIEVRGVDGENGLRGTIKTMLTRREAYIAIFIVSSIVTLITNINSCQMDKNQTNRQEKIQSQ